MHRLLKRQIKKTLGLKHEIIEGLESFFNLIDEQYNENDKERILLENALIVNSGELTESNEQLHYLAFYDSLTGLTNRKLFEKELDLTLRQVRRKRRNIALLFLDLDNFKNVNDTLGHDVGDALLKEVGVIVESRIRECDTLARWGGDEFILLLDELTSLEDCTIIVEDIQKAFSMPIRILKHELKISFSIGINFYEDGQDSAQMIKNADMAMYTAKEAGRNQYSFYTSEIGKKVISDIKLDTDLQNAIKNKEFVLMYQPQIDILTQSIVGCEALIRWQHPTDGLISPYEFIAFAEEKGYIYEIGRQVLEQACIDMKSWISSGATIQTMAVNLSVKQIRDNKFLEVVKETLLQSDLKAKYLEFEITETMLMHEYEHAYRVLDELRSIGITISIDDFGTGYSSLAYLKKLPIHKIKIDKSFIDEIEHDENDIEITKAIIALSHSLGLDVLAEGVENKSQLEILKKLKCDKYQGYFYSKPVRAKELKRLLEVQKTVVIDTKTQGDYII